MSTNSITMDNAQYKASPAALQQFFNDSIGGTEGKGWWHTGCTTAFDPHECGAGSTMVNKKSCGFMDLGFQLTCVKSKWPEQNKSACCVGDKSVRDENGKLDFMKCAIANKEADSRYGGDEFAWAPFSEACLGDQRTLDWCAGQDEKTGKSRLLSSSNCLKWCKDEKDKCDDAKIIYCSNNPDAAECICTNPQDNKYYKEVIDKANQMGIQIPSSDILCWLPACQGADLVNQLWTDDMRGRKENCKGTPFSLCQQIIDASKAGRDIKISDNDFKIVCNKDLPGPDPKPTPGPTPGPTPKPQPFFDTRAKVIAASTGGGFLLLAVIVLVILYILYRRRK